MTTKKPKFFGLRKKANRRKGFSLAELIVVIAIIAVFTAILAPSLLVHTERSRAQRDVTAMDEVANAVYLALSNPAVYDELIDGSLPENVSCYIDTDNEDGNTKIPTKEATRLGEHDQYTFGDEYRQRDEVKYYAAGNMFGVTITFEAYQSSNKDGYALSDAVVNKFLSDGTTKLTDYPNLYNALRSTIGERIEISSNTYENSDYTVFVVTGTTGGNEITDAETMDVYGQYSGTNLPSDEIKYYVAAGRDVSDPSAGTDPGNDDVHRHIWVSVVRDDLLKSAATCKSPAVYYKHCSTCGAISSDTFTYGSPIPHAYTVSVQTPATCITKGTSKYTCSVCKHSYTVQDIEINSSNHASEPTKKLATASACLGYQCCGAVYDDTHNIPSSGGSGAHKACVDCGYSVTAHVYSASVQTPATCTEMGTTRYTCECGHTYTEQDIPALQHDFSVMDASADYLASAGNCTTKAIYYYRCSRCTARGTETYEHGSISSHSYGPIATCKTPQVCTACGVELNPVNPENHTGNIVKASTEGVCKKYDCCGASYDTTHGTYTTSTSVAATCTAKGKTRYDCPDCDYYYELENIAALGHSYGAWSSISDTQHKRTCSRDASHTETADHSFAVTTAATCTTAGSKKCSTCTKTLSIAATGHNYGAWSSISDTQHKRTCSNNSSHTETADHSFTVTTAATCTTAGSKKCGTCTKTLSIAATGHSWGNWSSISDTQHKRTCSNNSSHTETANHSFTVTTAATCTTAGSKKCGTCTKTLSIAATGHSWGNWSSISDTQHKRTCSNNSSHTETANHSFTTTTAATCTTAGSKKCGTCTKTLSIAATGHSTYNVEAKAATCTVAGNTAGVKCRNCNYSTVTTIPANGSHTPGDAATCTTAQTCTACGEVIAAALGHNTTSVAAKSATCTTAGRTAGVKCTRSGCAYNTSETIAALGHDDKYYYGTYENACEGGWTSGWYCTRGCYDDSEYISGTGHSYEAAAGTNATCTTDGETLYECHGCGGSYVEKIPATGHGDYYYDGGREPTCVAEGYEDDTYCGRCNEMIERGNTIRATGHDYSSEVWSEATCTSTGTMKYTCDNCGDSYTETIEKLPHNHQLTISVGSTCTSAGYEEYECECGNYYREYLPYADHDWYTHSCGFQECNDCYYTNSSGHDSTDDDNDGRCDICGW